MTLFSQKNPEFIENLNFQPPLGKSHHNAFIFNLNNHISIKHIEEKPILKLDINKGDYDSMRSYLSNVNWEHTINDQMDVDSTWQILKNEINYVKDHFIPKKKRSSIKKHKFTKDPT